MIVQSSKSLKQKPKKMNASQKILTLLHSNDVYNLEERSTKHVRGAVRFKTVLDSFHNLDPLILSTEDLFQPSLCSIIILKVICVL